MSVMTKPLAAVGSGLDTVTEHLEKVDPRAVVQKLDPRPPAKKKRHARGPLFLVAALALGGLAFWFLRNHRSPVPGASDAANDRDAGGLGAHEWAGGPEAHRTASGL